MTVSMVKNKLISSSIVIPNYNGLDLLSRNLKYLLKATNNNKNRISEVIVVDDASTDESVRFIKENFAGFKIIRHKVNRGFSSTVNTGARTARSDLIVLLNNDVKPEQDFLESIYIHFNDDKLFALSLHEKGYGWAKGVFEKGFINHKPGKEGTTTTDTFWVSGGSGVFRRSYWLKLKGLDVDLFKFYWEDVDLCYRAQKRGWKLLWDPKAKVEHKHESTTSKVFSKKKMSLMQEVNQLTFIWKNLTSPILIRKHILGLLGRLTGHPGYIRVIIHCIFKFRKIIKARKKEIKESKVSDEAIFAKF